MLHSTRQGPPNPQPATPMSAGRPSGYLVPSLIIRLDSRSTEGRTSTLDKRLSTPELGGSGGGWGVDTGHTRWQISRGEKRGENARQAFWSFLASRVVLKRKSIPYQISFQLIIEKSEHSYEPVLLVFPCVGLALIRGRPRVPQSPLEKT